ncbi:hypothetical protein ACIOHC_31980 [Streptomyces sp. NPDC088252]|uniref:hypothetical protein n=1 Tax=Streptomyces sp. NPDC088252 TaxID=3365845 RepID=UPI00382EF96A
MPVLTYLQGVREGHPWADLAEVIGPDPVDTIVFSMSGWAVSGSVELGEHLLRRGALQANFCGEATLRDS